MTHYAPDDWPYVYPVDKVDCDVTAKIYDPYDYLGILYTRVNLD